MNIKFSKYQNAMILSSLITYQISFQKMIINISVLCNRKFGIGADGLILINKHSSLPFERLL